VAEVLIHAGIGFAVSLSLLFNALRTRLEWPAKWFEAYLIPIFKPGGSRIDPDSYRMNAVTSIFAKTFEKILDNRIRAFSERVGALCDFQGGFRADRSSTVDQIFILKEILSFRKGLGKDTFVAFLDVKKAYESVWRPGLLFTLEQAGLGGRCLEIISLMLTIKSDAVGYCMKGI
jgi:hypothetical protein